MLFLLSIKIKSKIMGKDLYSRPTKNIYIESVAIDLENFSRHAGRTTITTDDVLLLARRNQDLHGIIKDLVDKEKAAAATADNGDKGKGKRK